MTVRDEGELSFVPQIVAAIEAALREYEQRRGRLATPLDRALVISYLLGALRDDAAALWDELDGAAIFGGFSPGDLYQEMRPADVDASRRAAMREALRRLGVEGDEGP